MPRSRGHSLPFLMEWRRVTEPHVMAATGPTPGKSLSGKPSRIAGTSCSRSAYRPVGETRSPEDTGSKGHGYGHNRRDRDNPQPSPYRLYRPKGKVQRPGGRAVGLDPLKVWSARLERGASAKASVHKRPEAEGRRTRSSAEREPGQKSQRRRSASVR